MASQDRKTLWQTIVVDALRMGKPPAEAVDLGNAILEAYDNIDGALNEDRSKAEEAMYKKLREYEMAYAKEKAGWAEPPKVKPMPHEDEHHIIYGVPEGFK